MFVPRGVGNAHQVLEDGTTFSYLLGHHWTPRSSERTRTVHPFDPALRIGWPIGPERVVLNHRDAASPLLADAQPMPERRVLVVGTQTPLGHALAAAWPDADGCAESTLLPGAVDGVDLSGYDVLVNAHGGLGAGQVDEEDEAQAWNRTVATTGRLTELARSHALRYVHVSADCAFADDSTSHPADAGLDLTVARGRAAAVGEALAATVPGALVVRTGWVVDDEGLALRAAITAARHGAPVRIPAGAPGRITYATQLAAGIAHLLSVGAEGAYNLTGDGRAVTPAELVRRVHEILGSDGRGVTEGEARPDAVPGAVLSLDRIKATGFHPGNAWLDLIDHLPGARPPARERSETPAEAPVTVPPAQPEPAAPIHGAREPYRVLFVCTANICRSAYADLVANRAAPAGVEFSSAGVQALVGHDIDPPMAELAAARHGAEGPHAARQLTRALMAEADLVVAMAAEHRRFILDEWPMFARKTYVIGHVAREVPNVPEGAGADALVEHLWRHRTPQADDDVADPYRRGSRAAEVAAEAIDAHLDVILAALESLAR